MLTADTIDRLFRACTGKIFEARRDRAILSVLLDTGARLGELCSMTVVSVNLHDGSARVMGKRAARARYAVLREDAGRP